MKIDLHTHILPPSWPDLGEGYGTGGWWRLGREAANPCCAQMGIYGAWFPDIQAKCEEPAVEMSQAGDSLGSSVFVHRGDMLGGNGGRMANYWMPWLVGMPAETSLAICSVIFGGVLEKLPRLRICFAHGGGSFPGTVGRIDHGFHARPDLCAVDNAVNPRGYLGRFYLDSLVHDADALPALVRLVGPERIALGSDYPFPPGEAAPGRLIESLTDRPA